MNRIEKLIEEMCPEGVPHRQLRELVTFDKGSHLSNDEYQPGPFPVVTASRSESRRHAFSNVEPNAVTVTSHGAYAGYVNFWEESIWLAGNVFLLRPNLDVISQKYLFYVLKNSEETIQGRARGGGIPYMNSSDLKGLMFPIPPLEIQKDIVSILDKFTQLEAELEAELEAREKQYEEVRRRLLDFESDTSNHPLGEMIREMCPEGVESFPMHGCCEYVPDKVKVSESESMAYTGVDNLLSNRGGRSESRYPPKSGSFSNYREGDVLLGNIRPYLRKIWMADESGICGGDVLAIRAKQEWRNRIQPRFLFHVLASEEFFLFNIKNSRGTKMPRGDKKAIMKFQIPVPPLEIQKEIVRILDNLDSLVNSVNEGIPAEIAARRKQYEYYRDKLLTFKELDAA